MHTATGTLTTHPGAFHIKSTASIPFKHSSSRRRLRCADRDRNLRNPAPDCRSSHTRRALYDAIPEWNRDVYRRLFEHRRPLEQGANEANRQRQ